MIAFDSLAIFRMVENVRRKQRSIAFGVAFPDEANAIVIFDASSIASGIDE